METDEPNNNDESQQKNDHADLEAKEAEAKKKAQFPYSKLSLHFDNKRGKLWAKHIPNTRTSPHNVASVIEEVSAKGFGKLFLLEDHIIKMVEHDRKAAFTNVEPLILEIGYMRDASFKITLGKDRMSADITVQKGYGGKSITKAEIKDELKRLNVTHGIFAHIIDLVTSDTDYFNGKEEKSLTIAKGKPMEKGENTRFVSLCDDMPDRRTLNIDEKGQMDFRDRGEIEGVNVGDKIMQALPPTEGKDGFNIFGEVIKSSPGIVIPYADNLVGVELSSEDKSILVAATNGIPVMVNQGAIVEKLYITPKVNLATGNVEFDGTVCVKGDVDTGMLVKCSGDIIVYGHVERAILDAGGNVTIKKGIYGSPLKDKALFLQEKHSPEHWDMQIHAKGSVTCHSTLNAFIKATEGICVHNNVLHSCLISNNCILVANDRPSAGIVGGYTYAHFSILASNIGSKGCPRTLVQTGISVKEAHIKERRIERQIENANQEITQLETSLLELQKSTDEASLTRCKTLKESIDNTRFDIDKLQMELEAHKKLIKKCLSAYIGASNRFYPEAILIIDGIRQRIADETIRGKFVIDNEKLVFTHLN